MGGVALAAGYRQRADGRVEHRYTDSEGKRHSLYGKSVEDCKERKKRMDTKAILDGGITSSKIKKLTDVYETYDYELFKKLDGNREVVQKRKDALIKSFSIRSILNPIIVTTDFEIVDGQGRFEARRFLKLPIQFIVDPNATSEDCQLMNVYNSKWTLNNHIDWFAGNAGNENYIRLKEYTTRSHHPVKKTLELSGATPYSNGRRNNNDLTNGNLVFTEEHVKTADKVFNAVDEIREALCYSGTLNDAFYRAVQICIQFEGYDHKRMIQNCAMCRSSYCQMSRLVDQLKEFSRIYNYNRRTKQIFFEDYMRNRGSNVRGYDMDFGNRDRKDVSTLKRRK